MFVPVFRRGTRMVYCGVIARIMEQALLDWFAEASGQQYEPHYRQKIEQRFCNEVNPRPRVAPEKTTSHDYEGRASTKG